MEQNGILNLISNQMMIEQLLPIYTIFLSNYIIKYMGLTNEEISRASKEDQEEIKRVALEAIEDRKAELRAPPWSGSDSFMSKMKGYVQEEIAEQERIVRAVDAAKFAEQDKIAGVAPAKSMYGGGRKKSKKSKKSKKPKKSRKSRKPRKSKKPRKTRKTRKSKVSKTRRMNSRKQSRRSRGRK